MWDSVVWYRDPECMSWLLMCTGLFRLFCVSVREVHGTSTKHSSREHPSHFYSYAREEKWFPC